MENKIKPNQAFILLWNIIFKVGLACGYCNVYSLSRPWGKWQVKWSGRLQPKEILIHLLESIKPPLAWRIRPSTQPVWALQGASKNPDFYKWSGPTYSISELQKSPCLTFKNHRTITWTTRMHQELNLRAHLLQGQAQAFCRRATQRGHKSTYLFTESESWSMHALILFCASRCVMFSVLSPLIARIISPGHKLAMAALLPGLI